jgi:uncharacterized protein (TIGR03435 family)
MYSIDQSGQPAAVSSISLQGAAVSISIAALTLTYAGTLSSDGNSPSPGVSRRTEKRMRSTYEQLRILIQSVLADRFKLAFHHDQRKLSVYALSVGKNGPKLTQTLRKASEAPSFSFIKLGTLRVENMSMRDFCDGMQGAVMDKPVVDHTGLTGRYDFFLTWTPDDSQFLQMGARAPQPTDDPNAPPGLFTAIQEQLGLKLQAAKGPVQVLVIDHLEKPTEN